MYSDHPVSDIDEAWHRKRYDVVLSLLEEDSDFPKKFAVVDLDVTIEDQKNLLRLVEERRSLHQNIEKGDFQNLKKFPFNEKLTLYLNDENHSAVFTAIVNKQFKIYAFLKSIGADFRNDDERKVFDKLDTPKRHALTDALVPYFSPSSNAHIYYLISKSKSQIPIGNLEDIVKKYYEKLEKIPEISIIFKVIHYSDFLDIVFDFDNDNVAYVCPAASKTALGDTRYMLGRIYIAAGPKRSENEILGTIAHELTHMAMQIIYKNDCDPYYKNEGFQFEKIRNICKGIESTDDNISKALLNAFYCYDKKEHDCELIVRVPQILAQFDYDFGKNWLL